MTPFLVALFKMTGEQLANASAAKAAAAYGIPEAWAVFNIDWERKSR